MVDSNSRPYCLYDLQAFYPRRESLLDKLTYLPRRNNHDHVVLPPRGEQSLCGCWELDPSRSPGSDGGVGDTHDRRDSRTRFGATTFVHLVRLGAAADIRSLLCFPRVDIATGQPGCFNRTHVKDLRSVHIRPFCRTGAMLLPRPFLLSKAIWLRQSATIAPSVQRSNLRNNPFPPCRTSTPFYSESRYTHRLPLSRRSTRCDTQTPNRSITDDNPGRKTD